MQKYNNLKIRIKKNEGYKSSVYLDQLGNPTIGFGHLIKKNEKELLKGRYSKKLLEKIFEKDFNNAIDQYYKNFKKYKFSKNIEELLIEMIFQLGIKKLKKFKRMINYLKSKKVYMASLEMLDSLWYKQTPKRVSLLIKKLLKLKNEKRSRR